MDPRIREHAEVLIDWSARVEPGDDVVVYVSEGAHDLAVAVADRLGERGANLVTRYASDEVRRAYLRTHDRAFETDPSAELALLEAADVTLSLGGGRNAAATADVAGETWQAYSKARRGIREARLATDWVSTIHPTRALAQQAGMSYERYRDFVYEAILQDWEELAAFMAPMKEHLDAGSAVQLDGPGTDLSLRIDDRIAVNSAASVAYDSHNLPSGEVFTAPFAAEGSVTFDVPMTIRGQPVRDVRLTFEDGAVVEAEAGEGLDVIEELLDTDEGATRIGELGIGMNRAIDQMTNNIMFDEKMGDTVHLALGRAYDANLPEGESGNDSAVHADLITDASEDFELRIDGEIVQRDGTFAWED